jgi:hypothetical protein
MLRRTSPTSVPTRCSSNASDPSTTVGVVWRSEFVDPMRSIHFVEPTDLAPLTELDVDIVCLQHDATPTERSTLVRIFGDRVRFLDDLDLRDDFETIAAVTGACSAVVGVGTTTTELAAAVGTPTIYLHPNLIGAWRRVDDDGDYWHRAMRAAVADDYRSPGTSVQHAVRLLRPMTPQGAESASSSPIWSTRTDLGTNRWNSAAWRAAELDRCESGQRTDHPGSRQTVHRCQIQQRGAALAEGQSGAEHVGIEFGRKLRVVHVELRVPSGGLGLMWADDERQAGALDLRRRPRGAPGRRVR